MPQELTVCQARNSDGPREILGFSLYPDTGSRVPETPSRGTLGVQNTHTSPIHTLTLQDPRPSLYDKVLQAEANRNPFHMFVFNPSLSIADVLELFDGVVEDISQMYPHVTMAKFENLIQPQDSDNPVDQAARKAIINAFLALAFHWKAENVAFGDLSPGAWSHLKSAISIFPYLFLEGSNFLACEAILAMAMFMQGSGDSHMASQIVSSAIRVAQMGLCRRQNGELTRLQSEYQLRVSWTLLSLDIDMSFRIGILPAVSRDDIKRFLPDSDPSQAEETDLLRYRAQLAKIQFEVYHQLLSDAARDSSYSERDTKSSALYQELQIWKKSLAASLQPIDSYQDSSDKRPLFIILLHFVFLDLTIKILSATRTCPMEDLTFSARAAIGLMQHLSTQQFTVLWRILVYPVSAMFLLLSSITQDPLSPGALSNFEALRDFSRLLVAYVDKEQCNLGTTLEWVLKIEAVAANILARSSQERLYMVFTEHTDYLQLAQCLMGQVTRTYRLLIYKLAESLGINWAPIDDFGPLVPEVLKPYTFNFSFTFAV